MAVRRSDAPIQPQQGEVIPKHLCVKLPYGTVELAEAVQEQARLRDEWLAERGINPHKDWTGYWQLWQASLKHHGLGSQIRLVIKEGTDQ